MSADQELAAAERAWREARETWEAAHARAAEVRRPRAEAVADYEHLAAVATARREEEHAAVSLAEAVVTLRATLVAVANERLPQLLEEWRVAADAAGAASVRRDEALAAFIAAHVVAQETAWREERAAEAAVHAALAGVFEDDPARAQIRANRYSSLPGEIAHNAEGGYTVVASVERAALGPFGSDEPWSGHDGLNLADLLGWEPAKVRRVVDAEQARSRQARAIARALTEHES